MPFSMITPSAEHDWAQQRNSEITKVVEMQVPDGQLQVSDRFLITSPQSCDAVNSLISPGCFVEWLADSTPERLETRRTMISTCNCQLDELPLEHDGSCEYCAA